jgi:O-antigen/teichoic acid export membrane protein
MISCIACHIFVRRVTTRAGIRIDYASSWIERGIMGSYALPAALGNMLYAPVFWFCTTLLLKTPHGFAAMGEFSAANQWRSLVIFVPAVLGQAVIPIVADCVAQGRGREAMKMLRDLTITLAYVCVPLFVLLSVCSPIIMWAYGPSFRSAWPTFVILQAVVLVQIVESPVIRYMDAVGDLWLAFLFNCALALAMVVSASVLVYLGAAGLAWAILAAFVSRSICVCIYALTRMRKRADDIGRSARGRTLDGLLRANSPSADKPHSI